MRSFYSVFVCAACCAILSTGCAKKERNKDVGPIKEAQVKASDMKVIKLNDKLDIKMVRVAPGKFTMSQADGDNFANEQAHSKTLTTEFYIGQTEVTQAQYNAVVEAWKKKYPAKWAKLYPEKWNDKLSAKKFGEYVKPAVPFFSKDGASKNSVANIDTANHPVENISWLDAMDFCMMLNDLGLAPKGMKFTLPTETQWEFAARGGNIEKNKSFKYSGSNNIDNVAWYYQCSNGRTKEVGNINAQDKRSCNGLGLYDMSGNVAEWCLDSWKNSSRESVAEFDANWLAVSSRFRELIYLEIESRMAKDNKRPARKVLTPELKKELDDLKAWRVYRGGSWNGSYNVCRVSNRGAVQPYVLVRTVEEEKGKKNDIVYTIGGYAHIGLRLVLVPDSAAK